MILHEETYKRFGYWPDDLSIGSDKKIVRKCDDCDTVGTIHAKQRSINSNGGNKCWSCAHSLTLNNVRKSKAKKISNTKKIYVSASYALNLFLKGYIPRSNKNEVKTHCINISQGKRGEILTIDIYESKSIFLGLNMKTSPTNTTEFKMGVLKYMQEMPSSLLFRPINDLFVSKIEYISKNSIYLSLCAEKYRHVLDLFKGVCEYKIGNDGHIVITKGSFFKDGRWIHIG